MTKLSTKFEEKLGGEKGCHTPQKSCLRIFLNSEGLKLQCYHSLEGVLANLKWLKIFLAVKVEFFKISHI